MPSESEFEKESKAARNNRNREQILDAVFTPLSKPPAPPTESGPKVLTIGMERLHSSVELAHVLVRQQVIERELEIVSTTLTKEKSENNRLALANCDLAKELSTLRQSHGQLVEAAKQVVKEGNPGPPSLGSLCRLEEAYNAHSLPTDNTL